MKKLLIVAILALAACKQKSFDYSVVNKNGKEVALISDRPGTLSSKGIQESGYHPVKHPFLSAESLDALAESDLKEVLDKSKSFEEFVANLKKAGYSVLPKKRS
jgi:hypothetical protein